METLNQLLSNDVAYFQALKLAQSLPKTTNSAIVMPTKPKVNRWQLNFVLIATGLILGAFVTIKVQNYLNKQNKINRNQ